MSTRTLNAYMGYTGDMPEEGAFLIFAHNAREARKVGFDVVKGWFDISFFEMQARRLREDLEYLFTLADPEKLAAGIAHAIEDVPACERCEMWGRGRGPLDAQGVCPACREEEADHG